MYNNSKKAFSEAKKFIPGGVNSPVRAFKSVDSTPVFFERGNGSLCTRIGLWGRRIYSVVLCDFDGSN